MGTLRLSVYAALACFAVTAAAGQTQRTSERAALQRAIERMQPTPGHPSFREPLGDAQEGDPFQEAGTPIPPLSPLATGRFVNYETSPIKGVALRADGTRVLAVNTPAGTLLVIDPFAADGLPQALREIPVGLDPVSVAIQPGTGGAIAWVANFLSDDVAIVDVNAGVVLATIPVGDEPSTILFNSVGTHAYVVLGGLAAGAGVAPLELRGYLVTIDTGLRQVVHKLPLDANTPRSAVFDAQRSRIVIAAQHSGNNTELFGLALLPLGPGGLINRFLYSLDVLERFSVTAAAFAASSLSPYPDPSDLGGGPLVPRIVADAGNPGDWKSITDLLTLPNGEIDPAVAAQFALEFVDDAGLPTIENPTELLELIVHDVTDTTDHDLIVIDVSSPAAPSIDAYLGDVGSTIGGLALHPLRDEVVVANVSQRNATKLETNLVGAFADHQVVFVHDLDNPAIDPVDLHAAAPGFDPPGPEGAPFSLASPMDLLYSADGSLVYVAAFGPGRVGVLDAVSGQVLGRVDVGSGPRCLALDPLHKRLYVLNRNEMSLTTLDVSAADQPLVLHKLFLFNPEPAEVKNGRDLILSSRFSPNFASSCGVCHVDAHLDHLSWDLGDPHGDWLPAPSNLNGLNHPMKGPMFTLSLRGLRGHENFHWRGDKLSIQEFAGTFVNLFGAEPISDEQADAMAAYVLSIEYPPSPYYERDNSFREPRALDGGTVFINNCQACHAIEHDGALRLEGDPDDAGLDSNFFFGQLQEMTQLRQMHKKFNSDLYNGFGLIHDGRETREDNNHPLETFVKTFFSFLSPQQTSDLIAFVTSFQTNSMGVVGMQQHVSGPVDVQERANIDLMIAQASLNPSQCDVAALGSIGGTQQGYLLVLGSGGAFASDAGDLVLLDDLLGGLTSSDHLLFLATPPGSGDRVALDFDSDCILNQLDPLPRGTADLNGDGFVDLDDLSTLLVNFGLSFVSREQGDVNGDSVVDLQDLSDLLAVFGLDCPKLRE